SGPDARRQLDELFALTYDELRGLAAAVRRRDPSATLNPTALVNEAWIKLSSSPGFAPSSVLHFKRTAARAMRQVLIDSARRRLSQKRRSGAEMSVTLEGSVVSSMVVGDELIALDGALHELAQMNPRQAMMVETRFFGGLEISEIAELLDVSE